MSTEETRIPGTPCPNCGAVMPTGARFCRVCGYAIPVQMACVECGEPVMAGQKFCMNCGTPVVAAPAHSEPHAITSPTRTSAPEGVVQRRNWWRFLIPAALVATAVIAAIVFDLPGLLALRTRPQGNLTADRSATPDQMAPDVSTAELWRQAEERQASREWDGALALLTQLRGKDDGYQPAEVSSAVAIACANLARQAEQQPDPATAGSHWSCVLQEHPNDAEAAAGKQRSDLYLSGGTALEAQQYPQAIAAWAELQGVSPDYADVTDRLYAAYIAYGEVLCSTRTRADVQEGRKQYGLARALAPARQEVIEKLRDCQIPTPTPPPTSTPLPGPHVGVITDAVGNLRVRSGPGAGYFVLGKLTAGDAVTITGRTANAAWVLVEAAPERDGWVSSEYVEANHPLEGAPIVSTPLLPERLLVAQAGTDFSSDQGYREWFYLISTSPGGLKFIRMPWDGGQWYRWCCSSSYNPEMRISSSGGFPSRTNDVARLWVSPYDGQLRIFGSAHKESGAGRGGNGVVVQIIQNDDVVWAYSLGSYDTTGTAFDLSVESKSGDQFYFIVNALGNDAADNTVFDPSIELLHPGGADLPAPVRWADAEGEAKPEPSAAPTAAPVTAQCFEPRLRHYEEHKGCCAEVAGVVYDMQGNPYGPRGATLYIEGPAASDRYVREFGVDAGGGYSVTALSKNPYTIWLKGPNIRSKQYAVEYDDWANLRIIVDFYQVRCW